MRLQGPISLDLSGMHFPQRDHSLRVIFYGQRFAHDDIGASFNLGGRDIRVQAELQPATATHSFRGAFGEAETELGGSVVSEPVCFENPWIDFVFSCVRAGFLLAGLAWEIGYPILYDKLLRPGAVIPLGLSAQRKQVISTFRIAAQCGIHQLLQDQHKPRCQLRSPAFAVCGGSILDLADDVADKQAFALSLWASLGIT